MSHPPTPNILQQLSDGLSNLVSLAGRSIVGIHSGHSKSSGFVWRQGLIVTVDEVLTEGEEISVVLPGGGIAAATLVGRDPTTDVAVLRADSARVSPIVLESIPVNVGALVLAVGAHHGASIAAFGSVSFVGIGWRSMRGGDIDARLELDLALRSSSEGGIALDTSGRAFGMAVLGPRRQVVVIPALTIERVADKLVVHGRIARGYLGLGLQPVSLDDNGEIGVMVMSVDPKGPGALAGIRQGDIIIKWNDQPVRNVRTLLRALGPDSIGLTVKLSLSRGGETSEVHLVLVERPPT